jgi:hypothetical protein
MKTTTTIILSMFLIGCTTGSKTNINHYVNNTHYHYHSNNSQPKERQAENVAILKCSNGYLVPEGEIYW